MDRATAIKNAAAYADEVRKVLSPVAIMVYGSYVNGTPHEWSDIDVAVIFDGYDGNWLKDSALLWRLTLNISTLIEPILLDRTKDPSGFVQTVQKEGITV